VTVPKFMPFLGILSAALLLSGSASSSPPAQELRHEVTTINVAVPVRVFAGDLFVSDLDIGDFEVFEDGRPQMIEAVHLVRGVEIRHSEGRSPEMPRLGRHFVLLFELKDFLPEIESGLTYFAEKVLRAGDTVEVVTPVKAYRMRPELPSGPREKLKIDLLNLVRRDTLLGATEYWRIIGDLRSALAGYLKETSGDSSGEGQEDRQGRGDRGGGGIYLMNYQMGLEELERLRRIDEANLLAFAKDLKNREGQKVVFLFYQKEVLPKPKYPITSYSRPEQLSEASAVIDLIDLYHREISFDVAKVRQAFSDASIAIHFLFATKTKGTSVPIEESRPSSNMIMADQSEDIFSAFTEMALATGGIAESSANLGAAFRKAAEATESYYLLYYKPQPYKGDGGFRSIEVRVKRAGVRVTHRAGYFAN
jgi:VWFA-related protein